MIVALALAMSEPIARGEAMERCAQAVITAQHPNMGMLDLTETKFEWLSVSGGGGQWMIVGSIIEPDGKARIARRFTCCTRGDRPPTISFGTSIRL